MPVHSLVSNDVSQCPECGGDVPTTADRCPDCGADSPERATNTAAEEVSAHRDTYWDWIKSLVALFVGAFVLYMIAYTIRIPPDVRAQESSLTGYPLVSALAVLWGLMLVTFPLPILYFISKDKAILSREYEDITNRHWLTIGVFSLFSYGIYPLWYFYSRYKKVDSPQSGNTQRGVRRYLGPVVLPVRTLRAGFSRLRGRVTSDPDEGSSTTHLREQAQQAVAEADASRRNGEYEAAVSAYERAISELTRAKQQAPQHGDRAEAIEASLEETQAKLRATRDERDQFADIRQPLRDAESSFQTAIAEHAQNERTPARRDYRQAKDQYEQALAALDESDVDAFGEGSGLTVSVSIETARLPEQLGEWSNLSDSERDALADAGIGTLTELKDAGEQTITDLVEADRLGDELANRLRMALRWRGDGERTFSSRRAIERQRDRARDGQQLLS